MAQDILIKKGIVEKDEVLRGKGIDPDERRLEELIVSSFFYVVQIRQFVCLF